MHARAASVSLFLSLLLVSSAGCASWSHEPKVEATPQLSPPKQTPDSVVVEATLIRFPEEQAAELAKIWRVVDESMLELSTRRELQANGMRCGVLVGEMPAIIQSRLKELNEKSPLNSLEQLGFAADVSSETMRLHCHAGRRKDLPLRSSTTDSLTIIHTNNGTLRGATYDQPRIAMDLRATPLGDGRATLKMTPEVAYGEAKKRIVSRQGGMMTEMVPDQQRWDNLSMQATLAPGQFLFCTVTEQPCGVGQALFSTRTNERTTERVLLVIRLVSSQLDSLFAPEEVEAARLAAERS